MSVQVRDQDSIRVVTIDRPERRNAVDRATAQLLGDAFDEFEKSAARALVITGAGGAFCAGADLKAFDNDVDRDDGPMGFTRRTASKPVIAAIEGHCVAGGLEIALCADLRVAGKTARLGCLERRFGVPLIDGGTQRLPRIVGLGRALDLILTGRLIDAVEAEHIGLVQRVVDEGRALEAALALAQEIVSFPFECVISDRRSVYEGLHLDLEEGLRREGELGKAVLLEAARGAAHFASGAGRHGAARPKGS